MYPSEFVAFHLLLLLISTAETPLINKLGEFLLHQLLDLGDGLFEALLAGACHVQVQRRVLAKQAQQLAL